MEAELDSDRVQVPTSRGLVTGSSPMIFVNRLKSVDFYKSPQELTEMALKYLDADALPNFVGLNIINGSHWEKRLLMNEIMTGSVEPRSVVSKMTLALLEDSRWYPANYSMAECPD